MRLYAELARSNLMLVLERNNKLMNIEAVASSISHELKQPLGAILLNCETAKILLQRAAPDIGQTIAVLDETIAATNRANEQLEGARALFGRADREQEIINVSDIADRAIRLVARELRSHNIATRLVLPAKAVYAIGHGNQIQQVIINLLVNAIEALSRAPPENRVLRIAAGAQGGTAVVEIEDFGRRRRSRQGRQDLRAVRDLEAERDGARSRDLPHDRRSAWRQARDRAGASARNDRPPRPAGRRRCATGTAASRASERGGHPGWAPTCARRRRLRRRALYRGQ